MTPVDQTLFGPNQGDCFRACVASLLDLPIEQVPDFCAEGRWFLRFVAWATERGYRVKLFQDGFWYRFWKSVDDHEVFDWDEEPPRGYSILAGESPRGDFYHAVVVKDGRLEHDPHPSRAGVISHEYWITLRGTKELASEH